MAKRGKGPFHTNRLRKEKRPVRTVEYLLESGSLADMRAAKIRTDTLLKYHWDYYSEVALQRSQIQGDLSKALVQVCISDFKFQKWQRAVKYKYGLHPFSTAGSLVYVGGRFNTGIDVNSEIPSFSALYLAVDKDTALQETLGQEDSSESGLSSRELALTNSQSETIVSVSGELEKVFDLRTEESLEGFVELIKDFTIGAQLRAAAKELKIDQPDVVKKPKQLLDILLEKDWRKHPSMFDIPANSQIFGHLVMQSGIEGILYPSKLTGKDCLAIFPINFAHSSSYLQLDDEAPHPKVPKRIDSETWRLSDLSPNELVK